MTTPTLLPVGDGIEAARAAWTFGGATPRKFAGHVARSIPHYEQGHQLVEQVSDYFIKSDSVGYEIGTSTGTLIERLARRHPLGAQWIGIDVEPSMIEFARQEHVRTNGAANVEYSVADACQFHYRRSDFMVAYYTVQFVPPRLRQQLIDTIYQTLNWGGAFMMFEKVRAPDARFQDIASALYVDFKLENGYTAQEIVEKASSIKGVLEPFSSGANLDLLRRAGFVDVMTIFKHLCFEGFLAIK